MDIKYQNKDVVLIGYQHSGIDFLQKTVESIATAPSPINDVHSGPNIQSYIGHPIQCANIQIKPSSKVVFIVRNLKDIAVAMYMNSTVVHSTKFEDFLLDRYLFGDSAEKWCDHIQQWQTILANHPSSNLHLVYFTDLIKNFEDETQKLCQFLQVNKDFHEITELCSLLKRESEQPQRKRRKTDHNNANIGTYNDEGTWKQYFTVNQQEQIDCVLTNLLQSTNLDITKLLA